MQRQPHPASNLKHTPDLRQCLMQLHVGQSNSREHKIKSFALEGKILCACTNERDRLIKLSSQSKSRSIDVETDNCGTRLEICCNQRLACTTSDVENEPVCLRHRRHDALGMSRCGRDLKFIQMVVA